MDGRIEGKEGRGKKSLELKTFSLQHNVRYKLATAIKISQIRFPPFPSDNVQTIELRCNMPFLKVFYIT